MADQITGKAPRIRFKAYSEPWADEKIGDVLAEKRRPIVLEDDQRYELITVKRRNEGVVSRGHLLGRDILVKNYALLKAGDFVISKRQVVHGATGIVPPELDGAIVSNEYLTAVDSEKLLTGFLTIVAGLPPMRRKFFLSSYGVDIEKLFFDAGDWKRRTIAVPPVDEQIRISSLFRELDQLANLYQVKYAKALSVRDGMLQKMLPKPGETEPELRFKAFKGAWGQKKFGDFFEYQRPDKYIVEGTDYSNKHRVPVLTANKAFILGYTNETRSFNKPCLIFDDFTLEAKYVDFPFMVKSSAIKILTIRDEAADDLYFSLLSLRNARIEKMGHARHYIGVVQSTLGSRPELGEQKRISAYFRTLDNLICKYALLADRLQQIKAACLHLMIA